mgnify:CR=1 FL=1
MGGGRGRDGGQGGVGEGKDGDQVGGGGREGRGVGWEEGLYWERV